MSTRYYNPEVGRFINADEYPSTGQGFTGNNMFVYCGNNPIQFSDTEGTFFFTALGAITGFIGSALTTAAVNFFTGSNNDIFAAGMYGAIGGAIAGAGVDVALVLVGSLGTALPVVALAGGIAFTAGGIGNAVTTYLASDGTASDQDMTASFLIGGGFNTLSFGLSSSAISNSISGVSVAGMKNFNSNYYSGLAIATSTSFATEMGMRRNASTTSVKDKRMKNCYKFREC